MGVNFILHVKLYQVKIPGFLHQTLQLLEYKVTSTY